MLNTNKKLQLLFTLTFLYAHWACAQQRSAYQEYLKDVRIASGMSEKSSPKRCFDIEELEANTGSNKVVMIYDYYCPLINSCLQECSRDHALELFSSMFEVNASDYPKDYKTLRIPYFFSGTLYYSYVSNQWHLEKNNAAASFSYKDYN
ncbi:hypothetical protein MRY82_01660 [bacterium]|nr:hypothetical protein [bacterium]